MSHSARYDISSAAVGEFVSFLFNHEAVPLSHRPEDPRPWNLDAEVAFDRSHVVGLYTQLFTDPTPWLSPFSKAQLEEGFLILPSIECQKSALHGLGHLDHPDTEALIRGYLACNDPMEPELRAYAEAASRFEVL